MEAVPKQKAYNFVLSQIHKFKIDFEIQPKTSYRFLNKSILGNLVQKSISQFLWLQKYHKITLKYSSTHFNLI